MYDCLAGEVYPKEIFTERDQISWREVGPFAGSLRNGIPAKKLQVVKEAVIESHLHAKTSPQQSGHKGSSIMKKHGVLGRIAQKWNYSSNYRLVKGSKKEELDKVCLSDKPERERGGARGGGIARTWQKEMSQG